MHHHPEGHGQAENNLFHVNKSRRHMKTIHFMTFVQSFVLQRRLALLAVVSGGGSKSPSVLPNPKPAKAVARAGYRMNYTFLGRLPEKDDKLSPLSPV